MASTIKVNNIQNQCGANIANKCGSTVTLGASGDTITLACGASQTGFGRTGTVDWDTTKKTAAFTAVNGEGYFVDTTSSTITATLPASPSAGDIVAFKDYANTFDTNSLTIARNGSNIDGVANNFEATAEGQSITLVYIDATRGWVPTDAAKASDISEAATFITATGGTITEDGDYKIHTFTGPGTFCVSSIGNPSGGPNSVDYLIVAGGGGGGFDRAAGGGAGGYRTSFPSPAGVIPVSIQGYPITVGSGGSGQTAYPAAGTNGSNSIFSTITSTGGGFGGGGGTPANFCASPGGSGGGGKGQGALTGGTGNTPPTSPPQGNPGGNGVPGACYGSGGGGGAVSAGSNGTPSAGGDGGNAAPNAITGTAVSYAGGGGGSVSQQAGSKPGGAGGTSPAGGTSGGDGGSAPGEAGGAGTANTGGGGGGDGNGPVNAGGNGGSGVVVIRYKYQ